VFNFFNEIKEGIKNINVTNEYNIVNVSGRLVYIEGHKGLLILSKEKMNLKLKKGYISVLGHDLVLSELYDQCIKISGKIQKIEVFDA
jgi:sporulation protein YqfC